MMRYRFSTAWPRAAALVMATAMLGALAWTAPAAEPAPKPAPAAPAATNDMTEVFKKLEGTSWKLADLCGKPVTNTVQATLVFVPGGRVRGQGGVNQFSGSILLDPSSVRISPLLATRMAGPPEAMEVERAYFKLLPAATRLELEGDTLKIPCTGQSKPLQFSRMPAAK